MIEKILAAYAEGISAPDLLMTKRKGSLSRNTVYAIYDLLRRRLLDIGYYQDPAEYYRFWMEDREKASQFTFSEAAARIERQAERMKGGTEESSRYILAEIIFQAEHPDIAPQAFFNDIRLVVKLTGPLNRQPTNLDIWRSRAHLVELDRQIGAARRSRHPHPDYKTNKALIESLGKIREETFQRLRQQMKARGLHSPELRLVSNIKGKGTHRK